MTEWHEIDGDNPAPRDGTEVRIVLDDSCGAVSVDGVGFQFSPARYRLVKALVKAMPGTVPFRRFDEMCASRPALKVQLCHIRRELAAADIDIQNVRGWGYRLQWAATKSEEGK